VTGRATPVLEDEARDAVREIETSLGRLINSAGGNFLRASIGRDVEEDESRMS
jgi:hypothetical protein